MEEVFLNGLQLTEIGSSKVVYSEVGFLDLSNNQITGLEGIENFPRLKGLHIQNNRIKSVEDFRQIVNSGLIRDLRVAGNPLCSSLNYKLRLLELFPNLQFLDNLAVNEKLRSFHRITYCKLSVLLVPFLKLIQTDMKVVDQVVRKCASEAATGQVNSQFIDGVLEAEFAEKEGLVKSQAYFDTFKKLNTLKGIKRPLPTANKLRTKMSGLRRFTRRFR